MYTVNITWDVPLFGRRVETFTLTTYKKAITLIDQCKASSSFISSKLTKKG